MTSERNAYRTRCVTSALIVAGSKPTASARAINPSHSAAHVPNADDSVVDLDAFHDLHQRQRFAPQGANRLPIAGATYTREGKKLVALGGFEPPTQGL
jgi:hypothetical protein